MVVYRHIHVVSGESTDCLFQFALVLQWINPKEIKIRAGKAHDLEAHERNVIDKEKIACQKLRSARKARIGLLMNYDPNFYTLPCALEIQYAAYRFVECTIGLNDIIVPIGDIGVDGYTDH